MKAHMSWNFTEPLLQFDNRSMNLPAISVQTVLNPRYKIPCAGENHYTDYWLIQNT
jgi:hypothetical protein